jgi:cold shock CspA family protein
MRYGFIRSDENKQSYFFHQSDFDGDWNSLALDFDRGMPQFLEFEPEMTAKGLRAREVVMSNVVR